MGQALAAKDQWYVVHVLSGQENKVRENILKRVKTEEMGDLVYDVLLPTERVSEIKKGKKTETTRKFFPGYLIVNMNLLDESNQLVGRTWYFIRNTPGVIGFAGTKDKPIPMRQSEVDSMLAQMKEREEKVKPKVSFEVGETVKVADGPFQNQTGVVEEIDPNLPVENLRTMDQTINDNIAPDRIVAILSGAFAFVATLLASVGLYGVLAYTVAQRTREFGVRMALGAEPGRVRGMVLRQVGVMTVIGGITGLLAAVGFGQLAQSLLFEIQGYDPLVLTTSATVLVLVALGAGLVPARRASRLDPMRALRYE